jgi:hypothetical protein
MSARLCRYPLCLPLCGLESLLLKCLSPRSHNLLKNLLVFLPVRDSGRCYSATGRVAAGTQVRAQLFPWFTHTLTAWDGSDPRGPGRGTTHVAVMEIVGA